jgi:hypothetical protein
MPARLMASWAGVWLLGGADPIARKTVTLTTRFRYVGVGLVIEAGPFAGTPAVTATLAYELFGVAGTLLLALTWSRQRSEHRVYWGERDRNWGHDLIEHSGSTSVEGGRFASDTRRVFAVFASQGDVTGVTNGNFDRRTSKRPSRH